MDFEGKKIVVIDGASGMGFKTAENVVVASGSAVLVGRTGQKLDEAVSSLSQSGAAWSVAADLTDPDQVVEAQMQLAEDHPDATLLALTSSATTSAASGSGRRRNTASTPSRPRRRSSRSRAR
ncbi:SDR family NAD(P)-dependent oxidoreductase [Streptomyces sp. CA-106110]|uniref:SDR family NAD(P)-dependent oxidoreductase n=1 Tax=Streptomyces sp. CA-106110 TaxID=3240044 RepID=UPI003D910AFF